MAGDVRRTRDGHPGLCWVVLVAAGLAAAAAPVAKITPELRQAHAQTPDELFALLDTDRDGQIDRNEASLDLALRKHFGRADTDTDATIDRAEYRAFHAAELQRLGEGNGRR